MQDRRRFLTILTWTAALFAVPGVLAQELTRTPPQTEGPFYPDHLPLDSDNDLIIVGNSTTPAAGEITHLSGRVLDASGKPVRNALVEIWQADHNGVYINSNDRHAQREANFQGFGRFTTGSTGEYRFRTIKPVAYPGRTPHIHFKIKEHDQELLTTQCYIKGEPRNERDGVFRGIREPKQQQAVLVDFAPIPGSRLGELAAKFDIVLGFTPAG